MHVNQTPVARKEGPLTKPVTVHQRAARHVGQTRWFHAPCHRRISKLQLPVRENATLDRLRWPSNWPELRGFIAKLALADRAFGRV
jgi:hypothetical protein